jgi:hypothetical protein
MRPVEERALADLAGAKEDNHSRVGKRRFNG